MKERGGETEVKVNCFPCVSFYFVVLEWIRGKRNRYLYKKQARVKQAKVKEYTNHLLASELVFQDPVDQESRHY